MIWQHLQRSSTIHFNKFRWTKLPSKKMLSFAKSSTNQSGIFLSDFSDIQPNSSNKSSLHIAVMSWMGHFLSDPFVKKWFGWLLTPVVVAFILPIALLLFIWSSSLILYVHRVHKRRLMRRLREAVTERDLLKAGRDIVAALWDAQVKICL